MAIFSAQFLHNYLDDFGIHKIVDFQRKKEILHSWFLSLGSGKVDSEKEISIKSTFVNDLFGQVLGYAFSNANSWLLQQEHKSETDGTRSDAAFGYFGLTDGNILAEVRMVAEFKNSKTSLDAVQKSRSLKISAVDQAFLYAAKLPGKCDWVVVCNVREIRFYHYSSQKEFQGFLLEDLLRDEKLLELLFLFHAEHLLSREHTSRTDKLYQLSKKSEAFAPVRSLNVLDEMYQLIRKFDGLGFIDPVYLASLYPFNILGQRVWHYTRGVIHTTNPAIYYLLKELEVLDGQVIISEALKAEFHEKKLVDPLMKLRYVFERLNTCLVYHLTAIEDLEEVKRQTQHVIGFSLNHDTGFQREYGICRYIQISIEEKCDCISCLFRSLDYKAVIQRLEAYPPEERDLEYSFGKHLLHAYGNNNLYYDLEALEQKFKSLDRNIAKYMLVKMNLKNIYSRVDGSLLNGLAIKSRLEALDLEDVIAYEIDLFAPVELRRYLVQMKSSLLIERVKYDVAYCLAQTKDLMESLLRGDDNSSFDQVSALDNHRWMLYGYSQVNMLMIDQSSPFRSIHLDIFQAYVYSFLTPGVGLDEFDIHMLTDAILHIPSSKLAAILKEVPELKVSGHTRKEMLSNAANLLRSHYLVGGLAGLRQDPDMKRQMLDLSSKFALCEVFSSTFVILGKIGCGTEDVQSIAADIVNYLKVDPDYYDHMMHSLAELIENHGLAFSPSKFLEVFKVIIPRLKVHRRQYDRVFKGICKSWNKHFPEEKISDAKLIHQAAANHMDGSNPDYKRLGYLWQITAPELQLVITAEVERILDLRFNGCLYQNLLHMGVLHIYRKDYFEAYVKEQVAHNTPDGYYHSEGKRFFNPSIYNLLIVIHKFEVPLSHPALLSISGLTPFQLWLLDPDNFDYPTFDVMWLKEISSSYLFDKLKGNRYILAAIERHLRDDYDAKLAEIYFRYIRIA